MSLIIAAVALSSAFLGHGVEQVPSRPIAATASEPAAASGEAARQWVALIDAGRWAESWQASGGLAKAQVGEAQFAAQLQPVREPLGAVARRTLEKVTKAVTLPGAPTGDYEILQFQTDFASRPGVTETVVMMREPGGWKSVGYFLR